MGTGTEKRSVGELADRAVRIRIDGVELDADLRIPHHPRGVVIFAHGSGGGRRSPGSRLVAEELEQSGFATLLVDLLTREEQRHDERTASLRFDIALLASRLGSVSDWAIHEAKLWSLPVGYYGASTEAAAAILEDIARYNAYDCRSTLRLRDWLLARAAERRKEAVIRVALGANRATCPASWSCKAGPAARAAAP